MLVNFWLTFHTNSCRRTTQTRSFFSVCLLHVSSTHPAMDLLVPRPFEPITSEGFCLFVLGNSWRKYPTWQAPGERAITSDEIIFQKIKTAFKHQLAWKFGHQNTFSSKLILLDRFLLINLLFDLIILSQLLLKWVTSDALFDEWTHPHDFRFIHVHGYQS